MVVFLKKRRDGRLDTALAYRRASASAASASTPVLCVRHHPGAPGVVRRPGCGRRGWNGWLRPCQAGDCPSPKACAAGCRRAPPAFVELSSSARPFGAEVVYGRLRLPLLSDAFCIRPLRSRLRQFGLRPVLQSFGDVLAHVLALQIVRACLACPCPSPGAPWPCWRCC